MIYNTHTALNAYFWNPQIHTQLQTENQQRSEAGFPQFFWQGTEMLVKT